MSLRSGGRAASYESASEESSSSDEEPSTRRAVKSSVAAVVKPRKERSPSYSSRSQHSYDSEDDPPTPDQKRKKPSEDNRDDKNEERKRRHDSDTSDNGHKNDTKRSRSKHDHARDRDSRRYENRERLDDYDRYHRDHYGDSDEETSRHDNRSRRSRHEEDREEEIKKRRKEREKRHKKQDEEDRKGDEEKENVDVSDRSRKRKVEEDPSSKDERAVGPDNDDAYMKAKRAKAGGVDETLTTKTGGAYIPPARLRMMQAAITDKASAQYQRISWEALKKSVNGLINKVNVSNMIDIVRELFQENVVRARGILAKSVIAAQAASPTFTHVYASLVAIINTKFPQIGELILKRIIIQFKKGYKRNNKELCLSSVRFLAHLVNQQVAHEIIALEVLTLLLETPTDDSVEVTVGFLKECGQKLTEVSPRGINAIFERLRGVLHESQVDKRVQYMIEVMFAIRKDGFKDHTAVLAELDLVEEDDQFTHMLTLEDAVNTEDILNVFKLDPDFAANEEKYKLLKKEILDEGSSGDESGSGSGSDSDSEDESEGEEAKTMVIDQTETNLVAFRRTIYLTIQSSLDFEECAHKLLKMDIKPGMEEELCNMILDCCAQNRTYEKFFGLLAQRFCMINKKYIEPCQKIFKDQYDTCHRLETNKLRNIAKFFSHLLHTDSISWEVMEHIRLNEDDTTSSSRIFIKILFQELSEYMGLPKLHDRLQDVTLAPFFEGLLPRDHPKNTRFSINFFTSIGLGGLTDELRAHLKTMPKSLPKPEPEPKSESSSSSSSSSSSESSSSDSSSDSDSSSSSSSSGSDKPKRKKKTSEKETVNKESRLSRREALKRECERLEELCLEKRLSKKSKKQDPEDRKKSKKQDPEDGSKSRSERKHEDRSGRSNRKREAEQSYQKQDKGEERHGYANGFRDEDYKEERLPDRRRNGAEIYRDKGDKIPRDRREALRERVEPPRDKSPRDQRDISKNRGDKSSRNRQDTSQDQRDENRDKSPRDQRDMSRDRGEKHSRKPSRDKSPRDQRDISKDRGDKSSRNRQDTSRDQRDESRGRRGNSRDRHAESSDRRDQSKERGDKSYKKQTLEKSSEDRGDDFRDKREEREQERSRSDRREKRR